MLDDKDVVAVLAACEGLFEAGEVAAPSGYPDAMALCIIDSIWSMGVRYGGVVNVLDRYRAWVRTSQLADPSARSASELAADIAAVGGPDSFAHHVAQNLSRTSTRSGVLKASAVADAAAALVRVGVNTTDDLRRTYMSSDVESAWRSIKGQRSGISWHYLLILARVPDVKADRMVCSFVARAVGRPRVTAVEGRDLVLAAHGRLQETRPTLDIRALDHSIWTAERAARRG